MGEDENPREYDREYTDPVGPEARIRAGLSTQRDIVTRFVVQLETLYEREWNVVVRFDHDPSSEHGHDVTKDGVHLDVYRDGAKWRVNTVNPPVRAATALTLAEEHLSMHHERYLERFDQWHRTDRTTE